MKLRDVRDGFQTNMGVVSELCRKLGYSGLAIIWIVKTSSELSSAYQNWWLTLLLGYVFALSFDLLQYFIQGQALMNFNNKQHEKGTSLDDEVDVPKKIHDWAFRFYYAKFTLVIASTLGLIVALSTIVLKK